RTGGHCPSTASECGRPMLILHTSACSFHVHRYVLRMPKRRELDQQVSPFSILGRIGRNRRPVEGQEAATQVGVNGREVLFRKFVEQLGVRVVGNRIVTRTRRLAGIEILVGEIEMMLW